MSENKNVEHVDVAILGAGIAGLGAAKKARLCGRPYAVFEARSTAGGLLDNFTIQGFRFDRAVHLSFATEPEVRQIFDATPYLTHPADSYCFEETRWMKHPVQNNLFPLPAEEKVDLIRSFLDRADSLDSDDYEAWLRHQYGDAIAERFPIKYTTKYWGTQARELSTVWIGNRMRRAELPEILFGAFTADTPNTYYTKEMRYPEVGGYKSFIQPLIDESDIRLNHVVASIDCGRRAITFESGQVITFNTLVSTLPLPTLIGALTTVPAPVTVAASKLKATSVDLVSVGFNKPIVKDLWFYIYDDDILASRAYSPSIKSPDNVPAGCSSLQFEFYSRGENSKFSPAELIANTKYAIAKMAIAKPEDIEFLDHKHLKFGNVIFDKGMEQNRQIVLDFLKSEKIQSCGRFGEWDYLWSNQSFMSGLGVNL